MTSARRASIVGFIGMLVIALAITLNPTPFDAGRGAVIDAALSVLHRFGVSESFGYWELEVAANVAMFVPLGALLAGLLAPEWRWFGYVILPLLSAGIEFAQWLFLSGRDADASDILANSIGGWIGLSIVVVILELRSRLSRGRSDSG